MTHGKSRSSLLFITILLVLAISVLNTFPVLADTGAPPPVQPSGGSGSHASSTNNSSNPLSQVPAGTNVIVLDGSRHKVSLASQEAAKIVANGDPIWCPSSVAVPTYASGGCTASHATFALLLADPIFAGGGPSMDGTIWIEKTYAGADSLPVIINGTPLFNMANFQLTIKGGWDGSGVNTIDSTMPSVFDEPLSIINWNNNVTLSDIAIATIPAAAAALTVNTSKNITLTNVHVHDNTNASTVGAALNNTIGSGTGNVTISSSDFVHNYGDNLDVTSNGTITLTNVIASNSSNGSGAILNNLGGTTKAITVTGNNSFVTLPWINAGEGDFVNSFNYNYNDGLQAASNSTISVMNITADKNGASHGIQSFGANLANDYGLDTAGVTLTGVNVFNENYQDGLIITSQGPVSASNVTANSNTNASSGVEVINSYASTAQPVTFTGSNQFQYDDFAGLTVYSNGVITLSNLIADKNTGTCGSCAGVYLYNTYPGYSSGVTITGTNEFNQNSNYGLFINSNGAVSLANLTANVNGNSLTGNAVYVDNSFAATPKPVTISGTNSMDSNYYGLYVSSKGAITANSLSVTYTNYSDGAVLKNDNVGGVGGVTLTGSNVFDYNYRGSGLTITSYGAISVNSVHAYDDGIFSPYFNGISLDNSSSTLVAPPGIKMTGTNLGSSSGKDGVYIRTKGAVSISNLTADNNGIGHVANLDNGLDVDNTTGNAGVTFTGTSYFNSNYNSGLLVTTKSLITLSNITANYNSNGNGAVLDNTPSLPTHPQNVTLTGTNAFNGDNLDNLVIKTFGAISLSNVTADYSNTGSGAKLDNCIDLGSGCTAATAKAVTLSGLNVFDYNKVEGLDIASKGLITASNVNTYNSYTGYGAFLDNSQGIAGVTLSGSNSFDYIQNSTGLLVKTRGAITISSITADNNDTTGHFSGLYGIDLENWTASTPQPVTISGTNDIEDNYNSGLYIRTTGLVTINNLTANYDGTTGPDGYGLEISNLSNSAGVTLTGSNSFYHNFSGGLSVYSKGPIKLSNVSVTSSQASSSVGAILNNIASGTGSPQNVTLTGTNSFNYNGGDGLDITTYGAISMSNVTAGNSTNGNGAVLTNTGTPAKSVTLTGTNYFDNNQLDGLDITSQGAITISSLEADDSVTTVGASFNNSAGTGGVTLSGNNNLSDNYQTGLVIVSKGLILINNITASYDGHAAGQYGLNLDNSAGSAKPVTLTGSGTFYNNYDSGIYIQSSGLVTLSNITADDNGTTGGTHGFGLDIPNTFNTTGVTLTGTNTFYNNKSGGVSVYSKGPITLSNVHATYSSVGSAVGALLDNTASGSGIPQNITITGTNDFSYNGGDGLDIYTYGAISLSNVNSTYSTTGNGATLNSSTGTLAKNVTLTGTNTFDYNQLDGLDVITLGGITASNLEADYNHSNGALLSAGGTVTLSGTNEFYGNTGGFGLNLLTSGAIVVNNVTSSYNHTYGAHLNNTTALSAQPVTLTGTNNFNDNQDEGVSIQSNGAVTLATIIADVNDESLTPGLHGADINNTYLGVEPVSLTGTGTFESNNNVGLNIVSLGAISLNNITATYNNQEGVYINNPTNSQAVKLTGTNVFTSNTYGLRVSSSGAITLNNVSANNASVAGVFLDNSGASSAMAVSITGTNSFIDNFTGLSIQSKGAITLNNITASKNYSGAGITLNNSFGSAGVSLTGTNTFLANSGGGLGITSNGNVSLANVRSDGNSGDGVNINTIGTVAFTCGSLTHNSSSGLYINNASAVTLTGIVSSGNGSDYTFISVGPVTHVGTCP